MSAITKERFLTARQNVRDAFNLISIKSHDQKDLIKDTHRKNESTSEEFKLKERLRNVNTVLAMSLANSHGIKHCDTLNSDKTGHQLFFEDLFDQEYFLRTTLADSNFMLLIFGLDRHFKLNLNDDFLVDLNIVAMHKRETDSGTPANATVTDQIVINVEDCDIVPVEEEVPVYA